LQKTSLQKLTLVKFTEAQSKDLNYFFSPPAPDSLAAIDLVLPIADIFCCPTALCASVPSCTV